MHFNLWGSRATRVKQILSSMNDLLWYIGMSFSKLIVDDSIDINKETLCAEEQRDLWNEAFYLKLITDEYYFLAKEKEDLRELSLD